MLSQLIDAIFDRLFCRRSVAEDEQLDFTDQELDDMWEDDLIDIKNFGRMEAGRAKDETRAVLEERRKWYNKQGLNDWAEQIDIALWIDDKEHNRG